MDSVEHKAYDFQIWKADVMTEQLFSHQRREKSPSSRVGGRWRKPGRERGKAGSFKLEAGSGREASLGIAGQRGSAFGLLKLSPGTDKPARKPSAEI